MNIFLTGGSGFIGRNIIEQLGARHTIHAPSHAQLELLDADSVRAYMKKLSIDVVIHGAVRPGHRNAIDPSNQLDHNMRMFINIARNNDLFDKMIVLSSGLVYDMRNYQPKMDEAFFDRHVPADDGGFSKYLIAKYAEKAANIIELRIFGIFGKYEDYAIRFISNAICKTLFDLPITIRQNRKFDYLYIADLMPILEHCMLNHLRYPACNVTPDHSIELRTLAERVLVLSGKDLPICIAHEGLGPEYSGSNLRLRSEIPSVSFTPIETSIAALYQWYNDNRQKIRKDVLLHDK